MSSKKRSAKGASGPVNAPPVEMFTAEDLQFTSKEFYNTANDDNAISVKLYFRCPPQMERALEVLRDSKRFHYQTVSDIIRHAITRHLEFCHRVEPDIPRHWIGALATINEVCQDADMQADTHKTFARMEAVIQRYIASNDMGEATRLMSVARSSAARCPDSKWRKEWLVEFDARYARYLTPAINGEIPPEMMPQTPPPIAPMFEADPLPPVNPVSNGIIGAPEFFSEA